METINDRMEMLVNEHFNGNKAAFAKAIGIERATLSNYIGSVRRSKPSVDMVSKIVTTLNVDARWLLTGKGSDSPKSVSVDNADGNVAIGSNNSVGNIAMNAGEHDLLREQIELLKSQLADKEKIIELLEGRK